MTSPTITLLPPYLVLTGIYLTEIAVDTQPHTLNLLTQLNMHTGKINVWFRKIKGNYPRIQQKKTAKVLQILKVCLPLQPQSSERAI